jgi:hypothetical protein
MSGAIACFLIEPTHDYRVLLRRLSSSGRACRVRGEWGCEGANVLGVETHDEPPCVGDDLAKFPHDTASWPRACDHCERAFDADDAWQVFYECVYRRADGTPGEHYLRSLAPGAMYDATWLERHRGPDGRSLILQLPDGRPWHVDGPSTNGHGWTRTGDAPRITARPSILTHGTPERPGYHGWLTDGVLTPC